MSVYKYFITAMMLCSSSYYKYFTIQVGCPFVARYLLNSWYDMILPNRKALLIKSDSGFMLFRQRERESYS